jgi:hypothetical protein
MNRKLSLKREVLAELSQEDLRNVGAGRFTEVSCLGSCYTFVSCNLGDCMTERNTLCLEA